MLKGRRTLEEFINEARDSLVPQLVRKPFFLVDFSASVHFFEWCTRRVTDPYLVQSERIRRLARSPLLLNHRLDWFPPISPCAKANQTLKWPLTPVFCEPKISQALAFLLSDSPVDWRSAQPIKGRTSVATTGKWHGWGRRRFLGKGSIDWSRLRRFLARAKIDCGQQER
jgi:hypothetical protein